MATQIVPAPTSAERTTAPLPSVAVDAMRRLERAFAPLAVVRAVTQFETAAERAKQLAAVAATGLMSDLDADSLAVAEDLMAASREMLVVADFLAWGYLRNRARHGEYDAWLTYGRQLASHVGLTGDAYAQRQQMTAAARAIVAVIGQMETSEVDR